MAQLSPEQQEDLDVLRKVRSVEFFLYYDSIVIGPGARSIEPSWFETFQQFADADRLTFFAGRNGSAGLGYYNTRFDRRDQAYYIDHMGIEFIAPGAPRVYCEQGAEAHSIPFLFGQVLPDHLGLEMTQQAADTVLQIPARRAPAGAGAVRQFADGLGLGAYYPGGNGEALSNNLLHFPEPRKVPASTTVEIVGRIDTPLRAALQAFAASPGFANYPSFPDGTFVRMANWYTIRIVLICRRRLQVRAGYTAPGAVG